MKGIGFSVGLIGLLAATLVINHPGNGHAGDEFRSLGKFRGKVVRVTLKSIEVSNGKVTREFEKTPESGAENLKPGDEVEVSYALNARSVAVAIARVKSKKTEERAGKKAPPGLDMMDDRAFYGA